MSNVLLTGANGFVGKHVYKKLVEAGFFVIPIDLSPSDLENAIVADIRKEECINDISEKLGDRQISGIVHLAACISMNNQKGLVEANCIGTIHMIELAKELRVKRFVYLSSIPIIGKPVEIPIKENHPINPLTLYHTTKYIGEQLVEDANDASLSTISLRISSPVGKEKRQKAFLERIIDSCIKNEDIVLYGKGSRIQNYIDVRDLAEAIRLALVENTCNGLYLIKGGMTVSNMELASQCISLSGSQSKIVFVDKEDPEDDVKWIIDGEKSEKELHYSPKYNIEDTINWLLK